MINWLFALIKVFFIMGGSFLMTMLFDWLFWRRIDTLYEIQNGNTAVGFCWSAIYLGSVICFSLILLPL